MSFVFYIYSQDFPSVDFLMMQVVIIFILRKKKDILLLVKTLKGVKYRL